MTSCNELKRRYLFYRILIVFELLLTSLSSSNNSTELKMIHSFLNDLPNLDEFDQLKILHLDHNQISTIDRAYPTIEELYLNYNKIYSLHLKNFEFPLLKTLDLSHNPIEYIIENFFSDKIFPSLELLKLTNAFTHLNPYLIHHRSITFSSLKFLIELDLSENEFEEFSCSSNSTNVQWNLSPSIVKLSLARNKLTLFDSECLSILTDLKELDLHSNYLGQFTGDPVYLENLSKIHFQANFFTEFTTKFFQQFPNLTEFDLSQNPLRFQRQRNFLPSKLKVLSLNSINIDFPCRLFDSLTQLEVLNLEHYPWPNIDKCLFKKLKQLKTLNLHFHRLKMIDERIFRPLIVEHNLKNFDIRSDKLDCYACSLRWLIKLVKSRNDVLIRCLDKNENELALHSLDLPVCSKNNHIAVWLLTISILGGLILFIGWTCYTYKTRRVHFMNYSTIYRVLPFQRQHQDENNQSNIEDITNDNVMLVMN